MKNKLNVDLSKVQYGYEYDKQKLKAKKDHKKLRDDRKHKHDNWTISDTK